MCICNYVYKNTEVLLCIALHVSTYLIAYTYVYIYMNIRMYMYIYTHVVRAQQRESML